MKVMIKCVLTFSYCMVFVANILTAATFPSIEITKADYEKKISFLAEGLSGEATLNLLDIKGFTLFTQSSTGQAAFGKILDMKALPDGKYVIEFVTATQEVLQPFTIQSDRISLFTEDQVTRFVPIVKTSEQFIDVSLLNNQIATVEVEINRDNGSLVYEEKVKNVLKVQRRYDMSKMEAGLYRVKITTPTKIYFKEVNYKAQ